MAISRYFSLCCCAVSIIGVAVDAHAQSGDEPGLSPSPAPVPRRAPERKPSTQSDGARSDDAGEGDHGPVHPATQPATAAPGSRPASRSSAGAQRTGGAAEPTPLAILRRAKVCDPVHPCPVEAQLLRLARGGPHARVALQLLGKLGGPAVVDELARRAVRGSRVDLRIAAHRALRELARRRRTRPRVEALARSSQDGTVRWACRQALALAGRRARRSSGVRKLTRRASDEARLVAGSTALARPAGTIQWTTVDLLGQSLEYTIDERYQIGFAAFLPVAVYAAIPYARFTFHPRRWLHIGLMVAGGLFGSYLDDLNSAIVGALGGGAIFTFGDEHLLLNVSLLGAGLFGPGSPVAQLLPSLGGSWRIGDFIRLNLELYAPLGTAQDNGRNWAIMYGIRLFGEHLFGDISFAIPIFRRAGDRFLKYSPLGFPLLGIGYQW